MRGILMVECLYHQTIAGNKTMTRRSGALEKVNENPDEWTLISNHIMIGGKNYPDEWTVKRGFVPKGLGLIASLQHEETVCTPRYSVGEVLYLKEPFKSANNGDYLYKFSAGEYRDMYDWKNKLFMPAAAARAFIRITDVRCERLLDISDDDCIAEGIEYHPNHINEVGFYLYKDYMTNGPPVSSKNSFLSLFKFANKVKEVPNLWVWCYSYELTTKP